MNRRSLESTLMNAGVSELAVARSLQAYDNAEDKAAEYKNQLRKYRLGSGKKTADTKAVTTGESKAVTDGESKDALALLDRAGVFV